MRMIGLAALFLLASVFGALAADTGAQGTGTAPRAHKTMQHKTMHTERPAATRPFTGMAATEPATTWAGVTTHTAAPIVEAMPTSMGIAACMAPGITGAM